MAIFDRLKNRQQSESPEQDTDSESNTPSTDTAHGRLEIKIKELMAGMRNVDGGNAEETAGLKAMRHFVPMVLRRMDNAPEEIIIKYALMFADGMRWVATGEGSTDDNGSEPASVDQPVADQSEEDAARVDHRPIRKRQKHARRVSVVAVREGVPESADSGSGHETEVHSPLSGDGTPSEEALPSLGSRSESPEFDALASEFRSEESVS